MKSWMRWSTLLGVMSCVGVGLAADPGEMFYWKAGSGNWSEVGNWYSDSSCTQPATRYPGADASITNDAAYFTASMPGGTITVDKDITIYKIYVYKSNVKGSTAADFPITFDGGEDQHTVATTSTANGAGDRNEFYRATTFANIKVTGAFLTDHGGEGMNLTLGEGADVRVSNRIYLWQDYATLTFEAGCKSRGTIEVRNAFNTVVVNGGDVGENNSTINLHGTDAATNSVLRINGGKTSLNISATDATDRISVTGGENSLKGTYVAGSTMEITGGLVRWGGSTLSAKARLSFTGGTLIAASVTDRRLLGTGSAVCIATGNDYSTVNVFTNAEEDIRFDSTLYVTNRPTTGSSFCGFRNASNGTLYGDGTMYVGRLYCDDVTNHYRISKIYLGNGLYFDTSASFHDFSTGARFGSWGDWIVDCHSSHGVILFGGELSLDLTDPFDGVTPHDVALRRFRALPDTSVSVSGVGGSVSWTPLGDVTDLSALELGEGVTFEPKSTVPFSTDRLVLGKDAKLMTTAGKAAFNCGSLTADPTARIEVEIPESYEADYAGAVLNVADGEADAAALAGMVTLTGAGSEGWTVASANGCAYYRNATAYDYDAAATKYGTNFWTGASPDGNFLNDPKNWHLGTVPVQEGNPVSTLIHFGGYDNLTITNDLPSSYRFKQMRFVKNCGPVVIRGNPLYPACYSYFDADSSALVSQSPFPVVFETDVISKSNRLQILADGGSYIALNGYTFTTAAGGLYLRGHLRIGGNCHVGGGIYFNNTSGSLPTAIEVLPGALLSVSNQAMFSSTYSNPFKYNNSFRVRKGGRIEFIDTTTASYGRSMVGWTVDNNLTRNVVDGEFDVQCPLIGWATMRFSGTGTLNVDSTITTNMNSSLVIGGGLTLTSRGAFHTVTANDTDHFMNVEITDSAVLAAPEASWTYGPEANVETVTQGDDRALALADSATVLTIASTNGHAIAFGDQIRGRGTLKIAESAKVSLAGALAIAAETGWAELARVGSVEGLPDQGSYRFKTVANDDGTVSLMAKSRGGLLFIVR